MLRVPVDRIQAGEQMLDARAVHHVARVLRVRPGEQLLLFDPERAEQALADVLESGKHGVLCRVHSVVSSMTAALPPTTLLQAIGKGDKLDSVVRDATELGVTRIIAVETLRSVVRLDTERSAARMERWRRIAREAARQCGRFDVPQIQGPWGWAEALRSIADEGGLRICLWENAVEPVGPHLAHCGSEHVAVAVGPEGGLDPAEIELAVGAGFAPTSLGPTILRTETVAAAVLGAVLVQRQMTHQAGSRAMPVL